MGPAKRTKRLEWFLQSGVDCGRPLGLEKTSPECHGCSDSKLTDDAREKRNRLLAALAHRQGTMWSWSASFLGQHLVFPENMSPPHRLEFVRIYEAARHSRQAEVAAVKARYADMCKDAQDRMNAARRQRDVVEAGGRQELETLASLSKQRANDLLTQVVVAGRDRDDWGNAEDMRRIKAARGCDVEILESDEPSAEWGWRTGVDVVKGRLASVEEARAEWRKMKELRQLTNLPPNEDETRNHNDEPYDEPDDDAHDEDELSDNDVGGNLRIPVDGSDDSLRKRKSSLDQSDTSKSQRPRMSKDTASKRRTLPDADPDVEVSDHEDSKNEEEEEAVDDESSVISEGIHWVLEPPAYKIAVHCPRTCSELMNTSRKTLPICSGTGYGSDATSWAFPNAASKAWKLPQDRARPREPSLGDEGRASRRTPRLGPSG